MNEARNALPREHVGWDNYRADWKGTFAGMKGNPGFTIGELNIAIDGDAAYSSSIQTGVYVAALARALFIHPIVR